VSLLPIIVLLFLLMWLFVIRPQRKRQSQQQRILNEMAPGDEVLTAGGVYGTVRSLDEDDVQVEIAPGVEVRMSRRAIAAVLTEPDAGVDELDELERLKEEAEAQVLMAGEPPKP
jgi:preprotein translocase subunit YajC